MKESVILSSRLLRFRCVLLGTSFLALAGLVLPVTARAQANFGSVAVGSSATASVTLTFPSAATLGSIAVVTQGAPNLDFTSVGGGTCAIGTAYTASATCTVSVSFAPIAPGLRRGAVVLYDGSGNVLATTMAYGNGTGPLVTFPPGARTTVGSGLYDLEGSAVDAAGNIFVANSLNNIQPKGVYEILAAGGYTTFRSLGSGFTSPNSVAVDGSGNVFVADDANGDHSAVYEILAVNGSIPADPTIKTLGGNFGQPYGLTLDGAGNVFVTDPVNKRIGEILFADGYTIINYLASGLFQPLTVAVDGNGNVFGCSEGCVVVLAADGYTDAQMVANDFKATRGLTVDAAGNLYGGSQSTDVEEALASGGYINSIVAASGFHAAEGIALDGSGNLYVSDFARGVVIVNLANPPNLTFPTPTKVGSADGTDGPQTVTVSNIGNEPLIFNSPSTGSNPSYSAGFPVRSTDTNLCSTGTPLGAGESCDVSMYFVPTQGGTNAGSVVLTDNSLNLTDTVQSITLSGAGTGAPTITWTAPAAITYGTALSGTQLDASASVAGMLAYTSAAGTVLPAGLNTLTVTFTPTDTTDYISATATVQLTVNQASQTITFPTPASQTKGTDTSLSASSTSGLTVSFASMTPSVCTVSGAWVLFGATGSCTIQATQAGNSDYLAASSVSRTFSVGSGTESTHQSITFGPIATQVAATTLNLSATASSGLAVSFQSATPSVCTVTGTTASLIAYGFCKIQAWQGGNGTYLAATTVSQQFGVGHASQTINFPSISNQNAATTLNLSATASSGLPVTFTSSTPAVCTVSGSTGTLVAYGTCDITASQSGNNSYGNAEYFSASATRKFGVAHASQTIDFTPISFKYGDLSVSLIATSSSGLPVSFASLSPSVCTVSGSTAYFVGAEADLSGEPEERLLEPDGANCDIEAKQGGNDEYLGAAPEIQQLFVRLP